MAMPFNSFIYFLSHNFAAPLLSDFCDEFHSPFLTVKRTRIMTACLCLRMRVVLCLCVCMCKCALVNCVRAKCSVSMMQQIRLNLN